jgi:protein subunit release factor B
MPRERVLHITINKDCDVQTFRCGGKGGQNKDKRETGVRVIHRASGARGESREERTQLANKRIAFKRMAETPEFNLWLRRTHAEAAFKIDQWRDDTEHWLDEEMRPENLLIEYGKI